MNSAGDPNAKTIIDAKRYTVAAFYQFVSLNNIKYLQTELKKLCQNLFNDVYVMDQNACSSPQLFNWVGSSSVIKKAKVKLWGEFSEYVNRVHKIEPIQ